MPTKPGEPDRDEAPRTDLPPAREPYYEGYFGTDEEEEAVQEEEAEGKERPPASREASEEAAGGDREIT